MDYTKETIFCPTCSNLFEQQFGELALMDMCNECRERMLMFILDSKDREVGQ